MHSTSRTRDALAGTGATLTLLAIVFAVPAALVVYVGWPLPTVVPTPATVANALRYGTIAPVTLVKLLAVVVWVVWLSMTVCIIAEVVAVIRGTIARALPVAGLQQVAGRLVAAAMLLSTVTTRPALAVAPPPPPVAVSAAAVTDSDATSRYAPAASHEVRGDTHVEAPANDDPVWVVKRRDSLWTIAERTLGDGHRWREIRTLNAGRRQPDGEHLSATGMMIRPGWTLRLPATATVAGDRDVVEVQRGDHLWSLAETHLGDGERWREIYRRNKGRPQPDGGTLTRPDIVLPGWVLRLPADAHRDDDRGQVDDGRDIEQEGRGDAAAGQAPTPEHPPHPATPAGADHDGRDGADSQGATGERDHGAAPVAVLPVTPATTPVPTATPAPPPTATPAPPATATPAPPATADPPRPATATPAPPATADPPRPATGTTAPHDGATRTVPPAQPDTVTIPPEAAAPATASVAATAPSADPSHRALPLSTRTPPTDDVRDVAPVAGIGVLAAALVGLVMRRRRQWLRRRAAGATLDPIDPEAAELERWLRDMADHDLRHRVERVERLLAEHVAHDDVLPEIVALELGEQVALRLGTAHTAPPAGVTASDDGRTWTLDPAFEMAAPANESVPPLMPALICCGQRASNTTVMLNLAAMSVVDIAGPAERVHEAVTAWTAELATVDGGRVEVVVVGAHHDLVEQFTDVTIAPDAQAATSRIERARQAGSTVVVLRAAAVPDAAWPALARRALHDPGLAVVSPEQHDAPHRVRINGERMTIAPHDMEMRRPEWLSTQRWDHFDELLRQPVRQPSIVLPPPAVLAADLHALPSPGDDPLTLDEQVTDPTREVRVLGPFEVAGIPTPRSAWADLLAYLATHRAGATTEQLATRLRCDTDEARRLLTAASDALGTTDAGQPLLVVDEDRHRLSPSVACDLERVRALVRDLRQLPAAAQAERLHRALAIVRGAPLCDAGGWAHAEGLVVATTALISDLGHHLATLALTFGDLDHASWAVDQALLANPGCELLHRDRMRICDARGDRAGLDAVMHDVRTRANADGDWVMPETLQLYERLCRPLRGTAAPANDHRHAS